MSSWFLRRRGWAQNGLLGNRKTEGSVAVDKRIDPRGQPGCGLNGRGEHLVHLEPLHRWQQHAAPAGPATWSCFRQESSGAHGYRQACRGSTWIRAFTVSIAAKLVALRCMKSENSLACCVASAGPWSGPKAWLKQGAGMAKLSRRSFTFLVVPLIGFEAGAVLQLETRSVSGTRLCAKAKGARKKATSTERRV
jgi:hypothetical protein